MTAQGPLDDALAGTCFGCRSLGGYTPKPTLSVSIVAQTNSRQKSRTGEAVFLPYRGDPRLGFCSCWLSLASPWFVASDVFLL